MRVLRSRLFAALAAGLLSAMAQPALAGGTDASPEMQVAALPLPPMKGIASWYGGRHVGRPTASGEIHSPHLRTAAHRDLPLGTFVRVTNLKNGRNCVVKVNDRGPYVAGRIIDLSERAARDLAMLNDGLATVRVEVLSHE